jgi:hypothetical protein
MKLHLYILNIADYLEGKFDYAFTVYAEKSEWNDRPYLGEIEIDTSKIDINELTQKAVESIEREEEEQRAEFQIKMDMLATKKANLLSIEHKK